MNVSKRENNGSWSLSPAYDLTFSIDLQAPGYMNRHSMSLSGKNESFVRQDLELLGQENDVKDYGIIIDTVVDIVRQFSRYAAELGIDTSISQAIQQELNSQLLQQSRPRK